MERGRPGAARLRLQLLRALALLPEQALCDLGLARGERLRVRRRAPAQQVRQLRLHAGDRRAAGRRGAAAPAWEWPAPCALLPLLPLPSPESRTSSAAMLRAAGSASGGRPQGLAWLLIGRRSRAFPAAPAPVHERCPPALASRAALLAQGWPELGSSTYSCKHCTPVSVEKLTRQQAAHAPAASPQQAAARAC